ncbi:SDR family oxidoreductase [Gehongia tenuis]|uniref:SDR family oxidoreductase n=1 Tax=Gehongia tenuis TaxID=2763655 RepID=A0A926D656_9FIRM|nr:SDR family oxidoreductase [Gehongia tenuis]MBC8531569.1 SDR family oxidoreductase [Gehongia tenuis]
MDQIAVITGGSGVLCSAIAKGMAREGWKIAILNRTPEKGQRIAEAIEAFGGMARVYPCDVQQKESIEAVRAEVLADFGRVDVLINGAGGNRPGATAGPNHSFFDLPEDDLRSVIDLNLMGTVLPSQVFGSVMESMGAGSIINIASMAGIRPLTNVVGYGAAKAAVVNFTQWLAVYMSQNVHPGIRVNAIAPGFFITDQNRYLLTEKGGGYTKRGEAVLAHTPMGRFGKPEDLVGAALFLADSEKSGFITGVVLPVDGGFAVTSI